MLRCDCGSHPRKLNLPVCHGVYTANQPMVHERDCLVGEDRNIPTFGVCNSSKNPQKKLLGDKVTLLNEDGKTNVKGCPCTPVIVGEKWLSAHPRTLIAQNSGAAKYVNPESRTYYSALTTDSFLVCAYGGLIEPETF